jgi:hypothetical protein
VNVKRGCSIICLVLAALVSAQVAIAGPYTDDLSKCVVEKTTAEERAALVRWMFVCAALHPAAKSLATVSQEQVDSANQQTAELTMKLITETCKERALKAIKYEGAEALQKSFRVLGEVAGRELFSSPEVATGLSGMAKYFDEKRLKAAFAEELGR